MSIISFFFANNYAETNIAAAILSDHHAILTIFPTYTFHQSNEKTFKKWKRPLKKLETD